MTREVRELLRLAGLILGTSIAAVGVTLLLGAVALIVFGEGPL